jgi:hypothetical protein
MVGTPSAAAMCIGPESLVIMADAFESSAGRHRRGISPLKSMKGLFADSLNLSV